nr:sigma 54-interacting transcriptional regulator [Arenimonas daejeonensis]
MEALPRLRELAPRMPVIMLTAHAVVDDAVAALAAGAADYLVKPCSPPQLLVAVARQLDTRRLLDRVAALESDREEDSTDFDSANAAMQSLLADARRAAATDATVLLLGESGTGKGMLARAIHGWSPRAAAPMATVNCPSLAPDLLESELFGHARGAFTGAAHSTTGRVGTAEGGTLFLDEVGDFPLPLQAKLLRFIEDKAYERVGDPSTRRADVRIVAATNHDLGTMVGAGRFRADLYYRLKVIAIEVPPLRARVEDIETLALGFLRRFARRHGMPARELAPAALARLRAYAWPGNVRELQNVIERAVILGREPVIGASQLMLEPLANATPAATMTLEEVERRHIDAVLAASDTLEAAARTPGHGCFDVVPQAQGLRTVSAPAGASRQWHIALRLLAAGALLAVLGSVALSLRTTERLAESVASVSHTQRALEQINRLWGVLGDRDSSILRYLLTGNPDNLEEFWRTLGEMEGATVQLRDLLGDNPAQRARIDRLDALHQERITRAREVIEVKQRALDGDVQAQAQLDAEFGQSSRSHNAELMRDLLERMAAHEKALLAERSNQRTQMIEQNRRIVLSANGLALAAGVVVLLAVRRLRRRADEAERARRADREKRAAGGAAAPGPRAPAGAGPDRARPASASGQHPVFARPAAGGGHARGARQAGADRARRRQRRAVVPARGAGTGRQRSAWRRHRPAGTGHGSGLGGAGARGTRPGQGHAFRAAPGSGTAGARAGLGPGPGAGQPAVERGEVRPRGRCDRSRGAAGFRPGRAVRARSRAGRAGGRTAGAVPPLRAAFAPTQRRRGNDRSRPGPGAPARTGPGRGPALRRPPRRRRLLPTGVAAGLKPGRRAFHPVIVRNCTTPARGPTENRATEASPDWPASCSPCPGSRRGRPVVSQRRLFQSHPRRPHRRQCGGGAVAPAATPGTRGPAAGMDAVHPHACQRTRWRAGSGLARIPGR